VTALVVPETGQILFTIGHSNHSPEHFCGLLRQHGVEVLVDVRSQPYSQYTPHFNRELLKPAVIGDGVQYLFMGDELGGRPLELDCYDEDGHVLYSKLSQSTRFLRGIDRVEKGIEKYRVALMCSEEDPTVCHRFLLIARVLADRGRVLQHIRGDGHIDRHDLLADDGPDPQMLLFPEAKEEKPWRSLRSVLPKRTPPISLEG
jgi:uncharacterized protein (DUF488 family)